MILDPDLIPSMNPNKLRATSCFFQMYGSINSMCDYFSSEGSKKKEGTCVCLES